MDSTFEEAVKAHLSHLEGCFAYETMLNGHLDVEKYRPWVLEIGQYKPVAGSEVLSSGCGSAGDLYVFMDEGASRAYGVEVESGLVELARKRFSNTDVDERVDIQLYDGAHLPYDDNQFDIIVSIHVIEHVPDTMIYLGELFRTLKPGGILFLDVPNRLYSKEQHTGLSTVHHLPHCIRDLCIRVAELRPFARRLSEDTQAKLNALRGMRPPYASKIVRACRRLKPQHNLSVLSAFYHAYTDYRIPFGRGLRHWRQLRNLMTTFRLVVRKDG